MKTQRKTLNFNGEMIYAGIDVHNKSWRVTLRNGGMELKTFTQPPESMMLKRHLEREYPGASYHCCYESGYSGFWIHDQLVSCGISCEVVHPADVPTTDKEQKQKTDKRDSRKLARALENGDLTGIYVHTPAYRDVRMLVRCWKRFGRDLTRSKNRIKSLLAFNGIRYPYCSDENPTPHWSNKFIDWLSTLELGTASGTHALSAMIDQMKHTRQLQSQVIRQIRQVARQEPFKENVELLDTIPGIGALSAMLFLTEIEDIRRFKGFDHLCSYIGLIPDVYSSGETHHVGNMTNRGNGWVREMLIECCWTAVRKDPALLLRYKELCKRMERNKAIVRIARKVLNRIRCVLLTKKGYEHGILE